MTRSFLPHDLCFLYFLAYPRYTVKRLRAETLSVLVPAKSPALSAVPSTQYILSKCLLNKWIPIKMYLFLKRFYLFIFREEKGGRKKERETSLCGCLLSAPYQGPGLQQACALSGNRTHDPLVRRLPFNPLSHTSQGPIKMYLASLNSSL